VLHRISVVSCPRNHFDRTLEQIRTSAAAAMLAAAGLSAERQPHHRGDLAHELDLEAAAFSRRVQFDTLDQAGHQFQRFLAIRVAAQGLLQGGQPLAVDLGEIGMQSGEGRGRGGESGMQRQRRSAVAALVPGAGR
jgi:hypothetical protein